MTHTIKASQIEGMPTTNLKVATNEDIDKIVDGTVTEEENNGK